MDTPMSPNTPAVAQPLPVRLRVLAGQLNRRRRRTCGDPQGMRRETSWTDEFGEHFEVRAMALGRLFSRKITRDPACGWTVTWDEVRRSGDGAIADASRHALKGYPTMNTPTAALEATMTELLKKKRHLTYVYRLPDKLSDGFCFGVGKPITFINVDWFDAVPPEGVFIPTRDDLITFIKAKNYYDPTQAYLVLDGREGETFVIEASK